MVFAPSQDSALPPRRKHHTHTVFAHLSLLHSGACDAALRSSPFCEVIAWTEGGRKETAAVLRKMKTVSVDHCVYGHGGVWVASDASRLVRGLVVECVPNLLRVCPDRTVLLLLGDAAERVLRAFLSGGREAWDAEPVTSEVCWRDEDDNPFVCRAACY